MSTDVIGEILAACLFLATIFAVMIGFPVAFTLAGTAIIFATIGHLLGAFDFTFFTGLAGRYFGIMTNQVLVAVPLFVFMGVMLERSRIAESLLETMGQLFGSLRGGLGISVVIVGALLAASTGIVGATVVTMGLLSLPAMMRAGYDPKLASGVICASGTLGQIIPPSTVLIFIGDMLYGPVQQAQQALGPEGPDAVSVGDLFAGALIPGLILVGLYIFWVILKAIFQPESCPALPMTAEQRSGLWRRIVLVLLPPLFLILAVLGSILFGFATPTESASVGSVGAMLLAALGGQLRYRVLVEVMRTTMKISSMVFVILLGASVFSLVFRGFGGEHLVADILSTMPGGRFGAVLAVMLVMFVLGFFLDTFEIIFIMIPITAPALLMLGVDPLWLGIMIGVNLQTSFLTPPFGFALFYLRGVSAKLVTTTAIYRGIIPFVLLQAFGVAMLWVFPGLATWFPDIVFPDVVVQAEPSGPGSIQGFDNLFGGSGETTQPSDSQGFEDLFGGQGGGTQPPVEPPETQPSTSGGNQGFDNLFGQPPQESGN